MTAINVDQPATDSTSACPDYEMLNNFFTLEDLPQIPFYDTPQGAPFNGSAHKKVQIKRRILEYQAKY